MFSFIADILVYRFLKLNSATAFGQAAHFFVLDVLKIYALLLISIYVISFIRAGLDNDRVKQFLSGKSRFAGYMLASMFGAVTPFCSCSSIPLFLGFTSARIPLGITMAFLITSPMINEVAVILLASMLGIRLTVLYVVSGISAGIIGGWVLDRIGAERYLMPIGRKALEFGKQQDNSRQLGSESGEQSHGAPPKHRVLGLKQRNDFAAGEVKSIFLKVWPWVLLGVGLGAAIHGFVPENFLAQRLSGGFWWTVPAAVVLGIPLYADSTAIVSVSQSLMGAGLPAGTALAFMMSSVGASFPEFAMLRQVMKPRLLLMFFVILLICFTMAGWLINIFA